VDAVSLNTLLGSRKASAVQRFLVTLAVPLVLLVSCSDDPEPILAPSPGSTPTPTTESAEPSPTESAEPESPEEFIRRWVELSTELQNTGDAEEFVSVSDDDCRPCRDFAEPSPATTRQVRPTIGSS